MAVGVNDRGRTPRTRFYVGDLDARVVGHQHGTAVLELAPLTFAVGVLDARPWLDQRQRRRRQILRRRNEHRFAVGRSDDPLVEQHVFLQAALEIVAESGVGLFRRQPAIIGLDHVALADLEVIDALANLDDANDGFVARHCRLFARDIVGHFRQRVLIHAARNAGLAGMLGELLEQFQIGKTQADSLDSRQQLAWRRLRNGLGGIEFEPVGAGQLDRARYLGNVGHGGVLTSVFPSARQALLQRRARLGCSRRRG